MIQDVVVRILDELRGSWRFRWWALLIAWILCICGWAYVLAMPNVYQASARVYVDTQTALRPLLKGLAVDTTVESELSIVRQALLSRPQLTLVAHATGLDAQALTPQKMEELIRSLQERIRVSTDARAPNSATDGLYRITFEDHSRDKALHVVETLLDSFVEDTLDSKRTGQQAAQQFLDEQIATYEKSLTDAEDKLADFKKRNVGSMPGEQGDYFRRLQTEIDGASDARKALRLAEIRERELMRQLSGEEPFVFGLDASTSSSKEGATGDITYRIQELEARVEQLLLRYTEKHPEVIAVRDTIEQLKLQQAEELQRLRHGRGATGSLSSSLKSNPVYQGLQLEAKRASVQVAELRQDLAQREARVAELKHLVDTVPEVEAELARLNRDYEVTRTRYVELVQRRETAKLSERADRHSEVRFQKIDPPTASLEPVAPPRKLLLMAVLVAALAAAGGFAYLLNMLQPVFQNTYVLTRTTGLAVLGSVSNMLGPKQKAQARFDHVALSLVTSLLVILCVAVILWHRPAVRLAEQLLG